MHKIIFSGTAREICRRAEQDALGRRDKALDRRAPDA
jgi:hypothetical protein